MGKTCVTCGKKVTWFGEDAFVSFNPAFVKEHPEYRDKKYCRECGVAETVALPFREAEKKGKRTVIVEDKIFIVVPDKEKRLMRYTDAALRYSYALKQVSETVASVGGHMFPSTLMTFEKIVDGKVLTSFLNCQYCKTRYDANQYFKCPQCGSPNTQKVAAP